MSRPRIRVKHGNEHLTNHSGLVHVGALLEATGTEGYLVNRVRIPKQENS